MADIVGVGMPADVVAGLEHTDLVLAAQVPGGYVAGDPAADDGDLHGVSPRLLARSGQCCGTGRSLLVS